MLEPSPHGELQDVMNNSPRPFIYVCVVSEFNLPEYEACLTLCPQHLVLVVSSFPKLRKASERLVNVLREDLPNTTIHRPDEQQQFDGENILELQNWIAEALRPCVDAIKAGSEDDLTLVFNATGGTKAIGMGLLTRMPWDEIHYKGFSGNELQRLALINNEWVSRGKSRPMKTAAPLDIARLYADKVEQQSIGLEGQKQHTELALQLWQALDEQETGIESLFGWLDELWSQGRDNPDYNKNQLTLTLPEALQTPQVAAWIERLSSLDNSSFDLDGQQLSLPGNNPRKARKAVRKWISGDWLEQLTHHWLLQAGVLAEEMARGVVVNPEQQQSSDGNREADVFVHLKGRSYLIEIKADVPPETQEKSIEQQLESMGDRFGKTTKVLMVGPHFRRTLEEKNRWDIFKAKLAANGTRLCDSRESLLKALGLG
ncbi:MAG: hypothetical protein CMI09_01465 [Oceanospirillaceae bacterium]|nr:hypothetical protein [Oceanospirillaceae bacterium]